MSNLVESRQQYQDKLPEPEAFVVRQRVDKALLVVPCQAHVLVDYLLDQDFEKAPVQLGLGENVVESADPDTDIVQIVPSRQSKIKRSESAETEGQPTLGCVDWLRKTGPAIQRKLQCL